MVIHHHRLENALARAEELIAVGNQPAALQLLHESIVSRWFQHNHQALDAIMLKFVELCVELRRGRLAKDGLHQYRSVSQNVNVAGLEAVMKHFLDTAEARLERAYNVASSSSTVDAVEDLEQVGEDYLACVWSTANNPAEERERSERETVTPWLRFTWETYRIILDICRHNVRLESLYRSIVERAFAFCRKYSRKAEFRRLSEMLRSHLALIIKYPSMANGVTLTSPESHQLQLELRFEQLTVATEMELWQEAFRSIEDIHGLFVLARKSAKPSLVMTYYGRLCRVFQMSNNYLYLAATLCKLFSLAKSQNDVSTMNVDASMAVLAIAATPLLREHDVTSSMNAEEVEAKNTRLAHFLGLQRAPTRRGMSKEIFARDIISKADETVQRLFAILESNPDDEEHPLDIKATEALLHRLESTPQYASFVPAIYKNVLCRIFRHVSQTQKSISFETLTAMVKMPSVQASLAMDLDAFILQGCRSGDFYLRIDHVKGIIHFAKACFAPQPSVELANVQRNKYLEVMALIDSALKALGIDHRAEEGAAALPRIQELRRRALAHLEDEHKANLARKSLIEKKREVMEEMRRREEREKALERAKKLEAEREAEKIRLAEEKARREAARREAEREEIRREQAAKREEEEQRKKEAAVRRANLEKMIAVVKRYDYLERAHRQEEIPLLASDYERQKREDRAAYDERVALIKEKSRAQYEADVKLKHSLLSMTDDYHRYLERLREQRQAALEARQAEVAAQLEAAKEARREKARVQAQAKREAAERRDKDAEERRLAEEARTAASLVAPAPTSTLAASKEQPPRTGAYVPPSRREQQHVPSPSAGRSAFESRSSPFGSAAPSGSWRRQ